MRSFNDSACWAETSTPMSTSLSITTRVIAFPHSGGIVVAKLRLGNQLIDLGILAPHRMQNLVRTDAATPVCGQKRSVQRNIADVTAGNLQPRQEIEVQGLHRRLL